jgi:hypothetical protein
MSRLPQFSPGEWYLLVTCEHCLAQQVLQDASQGKTLSAASITWVSCFGITQFDSTNVERYQHHRESEASDLGLDETPK